MTDRTLAGESLEEAGAPGNPLLQVRGITQCFGGLRALSEVNLAISAGEIVGLIGPNGSGKSTLLNVISGIYRPTSGRVVFDGRDITGWSRQRIAREGVARTFQTARVFDSLSVLQHPLVAMADGRKRPRLWNLVRSLGHRWSEHRPVGDGVLDEVRLRDMADRMAGTLPYGSRRSLEIARCLAAKPRLVLLDEPTAGLNDPETEELARVLREIHQSRAMAMVVIEHNIEFIRSVCPRVIVLESGELVCDEERDAALNHPRTIAAYLGTE